VYEDHEVVDFSELVAMFRGMRGHMVEAMVFLPWDDGRYPVASFSGTLRDVESLERPGEQRWVLSWSEDGESKPHYPEVALWERRSSEPNSSSPAMQMKGLPRSTRPVDRTSS
jgi:hypothetical protein